ncbi:hypothetical protein ABPG75_012664 [Micractinium tetrahymenae]
MAEPEAQEALDRVQEPPESQMEPQRAGDRSPAEEPAVETPGDTPNTAGEASAQRLDVLRQEFLSGLSRQAGGSSSSGGGGAADGGSQQTQAAQEQGPQEASRSGSAPEAAGEGEEGEEEDEEDFGDAASGEEGSEGAGEDEAGPSTSAAGRSQHAIDLEGLVDEFEDEQDEEEAAIDAGWEAAMQPGGALASLAEGGEQAGGTVVGGGGLLGNLLGGIRGAAGGALGALGDTLGKHVKVGQRVGESRSAAHARATLPGSKMEKKMNLRALKRAEKKAQEKKAKEEALKREKARQNKEDQERGKLVSKENQEAMADTLQKFAQACQHGDRGTIHLMLANVLSDTNQLIIRLKGLPVVDGLPWKPQTLQDFMCACFVLCIRATGSIELVNEIERLSKEVGQPAEFVSLVSVAAADEETLRAGQKMELARIATESVRGRKVDLEAVQAKRALVHEWVEKGYTDVLRKALSLAPLCIQAPQEPPLVTALRQGHPTPLIQLLADPIVRRRTHKDPLKSGVDEASPSDGATAIQLAILNNRPDVLREVLKHSVRWTMAAGGKQWTPLCYALAQGRAAMVPLLLAHAKRSKPEASDLAEYVNTVCDGTTALHRAVAANAPDMVRLLLESGADPAIRTRGEGGKYTSALHLAAQHEDRRPLLDQMLSHIPAERRAAVLNTLVDQQDNSLLHIAVARLDAALAQMLLGMGARPTSQSEGRGDGERRSAGKSPLLRLLHKLPGTAAEAADRPASAGSAEAEGEDEAASAAGSAAAAAASKVDAADAAVHIEAACLQHWQLADTAKMLQPGQPPGSAQLLRGWLLRQRGTTLDPLLADPQQQQPLGQAAVNDRNVPLLELLLEQPGFSAQGLYLHRLVSRLSGTHVQLIQRLLGAGASVHEREPEQQAPLLHRAAEENDLECVELLLARGADVEAVDREGNNVLHAVARQKEKVGVVYTAVVARLYEAAPQLVTRRNREFFLPSDCAPAGSAVEAQLEGLTRKQQDAAKVEEEQAQWERAKKDLTLLGPSYESDDAKRARIDAMLSNKLAQTVQDIRRQEQLGMAKSAGSTVAPARRGTAGAAAAGPAAPTTPDAASFFRQRPIRRRTWADLADELPAVVRLPVWPESLEAAAAAARADPAAAVAQILQAAAPEGAAPVSSLSELPWAMDIHRDAWAEWMGLEARHRRAVLTLLLRLAAGGFESDPSLVKRVRWADAAAELADIEVFIAQLPKGATVVFEVAPEVDVRRSIPASASPTGERHTVYHDILRIWLVTLDEGRVREALDTLRASYRKGLSARHQMLLEAEPLRSSASVAAHTAAGARLPRDYRCRVVTAAAAAKAAATAAEAAAAALRGGAGGAAGGSRLRRHFPPASTEPDSYTVIKFNMLDDAMLHSEVVERAPHPPQSLILLGRSGTGKTTCAVFRMFDHWRRAFEAGEPLHQVFVTVSATLKDQVAKAFVRLRNGLPAVTADRAAAYAAAASQPYHSFGGLPEEAWPLFLSSKQYLHMLDGTLAKPFFKRRRDGSFFYESEAQDDEDGMSMLVDLEGAAAAAATAGEAGKGGPSNGIDGPVQAEEGARIKVTFSHFQSSMFCRLLKNLPLEDRHKVDFNAGLAWQEIVSYVRAPSRQWRAAAGDCCTPLLASSGWPKGAPDNAASDSFQDVTSRVSQSRFSRLTEEEYLNDVGRKQAPNFGPDSRKLIYQVFTAYELLKKNALTEGHVSHFLYDAADVVAHMHRQLRAGGYRGKPVHELYCDEVQDFTQAELLLGLRIVSDPNGLFLCGDTCQTIARGIGFRFTDVKQLFYQEQREAAEAAAERKGWVENAVQMPDIVPLEVNYRTHSGVLDVAASVVQLLRRFFADHIDDLKPEQAFLEAPHLPLLLPAANPGNVAMLLARGSDGDAWKTEFGANQVVLRRSLASEVPPFLAKIDAVVMTVPQAKGLEFNDVFILNFFADSPCKEEWRILLQYLAELEEKEKKLGPEALPFGKPLLDVDPAEVGMAGARLAALPFDETQHKLLCEELKHLYTAVTRAKNAVVFFDSDPAARSPFYFLLSRLSLARVVTGAPQMEGKDLHQLGLSNAKSTPADWMRRAQTMVRTRNFEAASTCYRRAGNTSRAQACAAQAKLQAAVQADEEAQGGGASLRFEAGYALLGTAVNTPPHEADAAERREWLALAAAALRSAGEEAAAAQIAAQLGPGGGQAAAAAAVGLNSGRAK